MLALLQTTFGVGLLLTTLVVTRLGERVARVRTAAIAAAASGVAAMLYVGTAVPVVAFLGIGLWGCVTAFFVVPARTLMQRARAGRDPRPGDGARRDGQQHRPPASRCRSSGVAAAGIGVQLAGIAFAVVPLDRRARHAVAGRAGTSRGSRARRARSGRPEPRPPTRRLDPARFGANSSRRRPIRPETSGAGGGRVGAARDWAHGRPTAAPRRPGRLRAARRAHRLDAATGDEIRKAFELRGVPGCDRVRGAGRVPRRGDEPPPGHRHPVADRQPRADARTTPAGSPTSTSTSPRRSTRPPGDLHRRARRASSGCASRSSSAVAKNPGPSPAEIALGYEHAWDLGDFDVVYRLSGRRAARRDAQGRLRRGQAGRVPR